jgi:carboxyl-terminal processing protease
MIFRGKKADPNNGYTCIASIGTTSTFTWRRCSVLALVLLVLSFPVNYSHAFVAPSQPILNGGTCITTTRQMSNIQQGNNNEGEIKDDVSRTEVRVVSKNDDNDNKIIKNQQQNNNIMTRITTMGSLALAMSLCFYPSPPAAHASGYTSLTPEQKMTAEAWRTVDSTFLDRTFNGQDWFRLRQDLVKTKYESMEDAQTSVADMMLKLGDKYTKYLPPAKYQSLVDTATGTLAGVGVEIATNSDRLPCISDVEPNSPAMKAGLLPKDVFLEGDGTKFDKTSTPDDVALRLRGPVGSKVGVTVLRDGTTIKDFIIERAPIKVASVRSYIATENKQVGVIRIKSFSGTTTSSVKDAVLELKKKGANTILFDLRSNPGGLLPGGTEAASLFLEANKPVLFVVSNKGVIDAQETFVDGFDTETNLVILVDHNTASAAEVFTAALKENGRAKVVGEQVSTIL